MMKTAQIIDLNEKRIEKKIEKKLPQLLVKMDLPNLTCEALNSVLMMTRYVVCFSGDVEEGSPRKVRTTQPEQLLYAASNQLFQYEVFSDRVRLTFDGDYTYDLYLHKEHIDDWSILALVKRALDAESKVRSTQNQIYQRKLMSGFESSVS